MPFIYNNILLHFGISTNQYKRKRQLILQEWQCLCPVAPIVARGLSRGLLPRGFFFILPSLNVFLLSLSILLRTSIHSTLHSHPLLLSLLLISNPISTLTTFPHPTPSDPHNATSHRRHHFATRGSLQQRPLPVLQLTLRQPASGLRVPRSEASLQACQLR